MARRQDKQRGRGGPLFLEDAPEPRPESAYPGRRVAAHLPLAACGDDHAEAIVAALRAYFLTHTLDPLTGEIHTVH